MPVEVVPAKDVHTGGIFQLRQVRMRARILTTSLCAAEETSRFLLEYKLFNLQISLNIYSLSSSPGSVEANPGGRAFSSGLGHDAADSGDRARGVCRLCGDHN